MYSTGDDYYDDTPWLNDEPDGWRAFWVAIETMNTRGLSDLEVRNESGVLIRSALDTVIHDLGLDGEMSKELLFPCLDIVLTRKSKISPYRLKEFLKSNIVGQDVVYEVFDEEPRIRYIPVHERELYGDRWCLKNFTKQVRLHLDLLFDSTYVNPIEDHTREYLMKMWIEVANTDELRGRYRGHDCWDDFERSRRLRLAACRKRYML
jgi:hypothetical protein